ncbi:MAG: ABC transporter ATP-binding protein [candidate division KSB1 bacterium]|nr:ABC transporter ATP-binding protein [candidate division KSB1 bacterium]MDZ7336256.1 ABC transporter ATP-binding protein [candidate division KSB1 bacterium]MDZ7357280.1 ABC transporter ATP-binding protein [candidate division KSB1 bacterium]MDZ7377547.1 ABC transporter ATP-binding protein [candidate division KSB1 bacterium]MDZ7401442.1 ABC transporter ATP-binding protein [candidate division KSB1 bacterium]
MHAIETRAATKYFYENPDNGSIKKFRGIGLRKKKKRVAAVDSITFHVKRGEIFGIIGPNGSGKSTLIRMLSTLVLPDSGELKVFGLDVVKQSMQVRRKINRVSVDAAFFKRLSAWENLAYAARLYGLNPKRAKKQAMDILESMNFPISKMDQSLEELSRGMQQKVAIARALFTSPVLLLLDEPTTGLDPVSKRQVQQYILEIRNQHDTTVLLTSHDLDEVERICDRIAIIDKGKFVVCDTLENLKRQFSNNGHPKSLEEIFTEVTGKNLALDEEE